MKRLSEIKENVEKGLISNNTDLCKLMIDEGSDKGTGWHNYTPIYSFLFEDIRNSNINFMELGIFHGASARAWRKYFSNAKIYLADINEEYLIRDVGYSSHICDQDNTQSIQKMWDEIGNQILFDVIIDDGKHEFYSNINFLLGSIQKLKTGGIFIVEDLTINTWNSFSECADRLRSELSLSEICMLDIPNNLNNVDNRLLILKK